MDKLDRSLIAALRKDGRAPISELAKSLSVSRGTIQNRLERLLTSGTILGFTVRVREDVTQDAIRSVMMIKVTGKSTAQVIIKLRGIPQLRKIHTTNGAWDLVAEITTSSLAELDQVLRAVRVIDGVLGSETSLLLSSV